MEETKPDNLLSILAELKWKHGYICRKCGHDQYKAGSKSEGARKCKKCDTEESLKRYTVFDNSKIPIEKAYALMDYLIKACFIERDEKWFKVANSISFPDEKYLYDSKLTLDEFINRGYPRIEAIKRRISKMDDYMERWLKMHDKNMHVYEKEYGNVENFKMQKLFSPLHVMKPTSDEKQNKLSYLEFIERANDARNRLQALHETKRNWFEKKVLRFFRHKKPKISVLAEKFDLEENTINLFMKKIHERFKCFRGFQVRANEEGGYYEDIVNFLHYHKYHLHDYFGLFMFPITTELEDGEVKIERKWYSLKHDGVEWNLIPLLFGRNDQNGVMKSYYNKPEEEEFLSVE